MFKSPRHALQFAFRTMAVPIIKMSSINNMRGGGGNLDMTPHDRHAQAAMIVAMVERATSEVGMAYLKARYAKELAGGEDAHDVASKLTRIAMAGLPTGVHSNRGVARMICVYFGAEFSMISLRTSLKCNNRKYYEYKQNIYNSMDDVGRVAESDAARVIEDAGLIIEEVAA